jgi:multiple sugar transport system substrate-binding protein
MAITKRAVLGAGLAALAAPAIRAAPAKLTIFSHRIHQIVATGAQGGDITAEWTKQTGVKVEWVTFETAELEERLFREASLSSTDVDIGFILNTQATKRLATLFERLDATMAKEPVEDPPDIFAGLSQAMTVEGVLYGVPFRHASSGLHYNEEMFAERGITGPPATMEDLLAAAKACTYTRSGQRVAGLVTGGLGYADIIAFARAWDGDFITTDFKVVADQPPMVTAIGTLRGMYEGGTLPRGIAAINGEDVNQWMQTGRAATILGAMGRNAIYNDPAKSRFPGKIKTVPIPVIAALKDKYPVAPTKVESWGMAIPGASANKDLAWSLIRAMSSKQSTVMAALNGNGPVRASAYDDPRIRAKLPFAEAERQVLKVSRVAIPAFDNAAKAADVFQEEVQAAVLGLKPVDVAMADCTKRTKLLMA